MIVKPESKLSTALKAIFNLFVPPASPGKPHEPGPLIIRTGPGSAPVYIEGAIQEPTDKEIEDMSKTGKRYADIPFEIQ